MILKQRSPVGLVMMGLIMIGVFSCRPAVAQTAPNSEQQRRLAEQKLKLVEMLIESPAAQAKRDGSNADTAALIDRGRELLKQARENLAAQHYGEAAQMLDEALRSVSKVNRQKSGGLSESAQRQRMKDMSEQVATYRASLAELAKAQGNTTSAQASLRRVDELAEEGSKLAAAGRLGEANKKMAEAYKLEVEEISRLRDGQIVVMSLNFKSPADEYAYEQKRFHSNEILVGMMIAEGRAAGDKRRLVDTFINEATRHKQEAAELAQANSHKEAVAAMEKAVVQLNRALQSMGVPVF